MAFVAWQREAKFPATLVPFLTSFLLALVSVVPLNLPGFAPVAPSFTLMAVAHWTFYRPDLLPLSAVFLLGLMIDLLTGTPYVGLSPLILLGVRSVVLSGRRYFIEYAFPALWAGFLGLAAASFGGEWALVSLLNGRVLGSRPFVFEAVLTVACFPVATWLLARVQRAVLAGPR